MKSNQCPNRNHSRVNVPVRYCPNCGDVVNEQIAVKRCGEDKHAKERHDGSRFCIDCGTRLIT